MKTILVTNCKTPFDIAIVAGLLESSFVVCFHNDQHINIFETVNEHPHFQLILGAKENIQMFISLLEIYQPDYYYNFADHIDSDSIGKQILAKKLIAGIICYQTGELNGKSI
jgi:hypothetical protein